MKNIFTTTFFLILCANILMAQKNVSKMSQEVYQAYTSVAAYEAQVKALGQAPEGVISSNVFVRCDVKTVRPYFEQLGGVVEGKPTEGILRGVISANMLDSLAAHPLVFNVEKGNMPQNALADTAYAHANINALLVYSGGGSLSRAYKGNGTLIGIIDSGVDFKHADFRNANGTTRLVEYWDLNCVSGCTPPTGYTNGSLYNQQQINAAITSGSSTITPDEYGHGTCIAGLAGGNGFSTTDRKFAGIAHQAQFLVVDLTPYFYSNDIITGIEYLIRRSNELGKPIAINVSFGSSFGPHDGSDVYSTTIDQMLQNETGKALVFAAGNDGNKLMHLRHQSTNATQEQSTWFQKAANMGDIYYQLYADNGEFENMKYRIDVDVRNAQGIYQKANVSLSYKNIKNLPATTYDTIRNAAGQVLGTAFLYSYQYNANTTHVSYSIRPAAGYTSAMWRFSTQGNGLVDIWNREALKMNYNTDSINSSELAATYTRPDNNISIAGGFNCAKNAITVGSYVNTNAFTFAGQTVTGTKGARQKESSSGITRDERIKPEIMAPGAIVVGPKVATLPGNANLATIDGLHRYAAGTSYAAPFVTGALALYLETNPDATQAEIQMHIKNSAVTDAFTGTGAAIPNANWGYGKLDVYELLLKGESTWRALSVNLVQFNAEKDKTSATPKTKLQWTTASETNNDHFDLEYSTDGKNFEVIDNLLGKGNSSTATTYTSTHFTPIVGTNYYRLVAVEFSGKREVTPIQKVIFGKDSRLAAVEMAVYPNPATSNGSMFINIQNCQEQANLVVTNIYGSVVYSDVLPNGTKQLNLNLKAGIYFVGVSDVFDESNKTVQKLIVQ